jgi:hypothetical protein
MYDGSGYPQSSGQYFLFFSDTRRSNLLVCSGQNNGRGGNLSHRGEADLANLRAYIALSPHHATV